MSKIFSSWVLRKMSCVNCVIKIFHCMYLNTLKTHLLRKLLNFASLCKYETHFVLFTDDHFRLETYSINIYLHDSSLLQNISLLVHLANSTFHHLQYPRCPTSYVNSNYRALCNLNSTNMKYFLDIRQYQEQI